MSVVAISVNPEGTLAGSGLGKATHMAIAKVEHGEILEWQVHPVGWDVLHDVGEHGSHHARIVKFMLEHGVTHVAAGHAGPPMQNTLAKMGLHLTLDVSGDPRAVALAIG